MALEVDDVSIRRHRFARGKVVERYFIKRRRRSEGGNMAADAILHPLARTTMAMAFQRTRLLMRRSISWLPGNGACWRDRNRVLVRSCGGERQIDPSFPRHAEKAAAEAAPPAPGRPSITHNPANQPILGSQVLLIHQSATLPRLGSPSMNTNLQ